VSAKPRRRILAPIEFPNGHVYLVRPVDAAQATSWLARRRAHRTKRKCRSLSGRTSQASTLTHRAAQLRSGVSHLHAREGTAGSRVEKESAQV